MSFARRYAAVPVLALLVIAVAVPQSASAAAEVSCGTPAQCDALTKNREAYVAACMVKAGQDADAYCRCTLREFTRGKGPLEEGKVAPGRAAELISKTMATCGPVHPGIIAHSASCADSAGEGSDAYCACSLKLMLPRILGGKARMSVREQETQAKLTTAKCGDMMPEPPVEKNFVKSCAASIRSCAGAKSGPACTCVFHELRTTYKHGLHEFLGTALPAVINKDMLRAAPKCEVPACTPTPGE